MKRKSDGHNDSEKTSASILMTREAAKTAGIPFDEPKPVSCPWCGKALEPLGATFGGKVRWFTHSRCGCEGEIAYEEKGRAEERRHDQEMMARRVAAAGIQRRYREAQTSTPEIVNYLNAFGDSEGMGLYIHGGVGSGKTYAATALARALIYAGYSVMMATSTSMLDTIADTYGKNAKSSDGVGRYATCDMLVIDDLGKENASAWAVNTLFQILNARYEAMLATVITSQYSFDALEKRMARSGERESAAAIVSRLKQVCTEIRLTSTDKRISR